MRRFIVSFFALFFLVSCGNDHWAGESSPSSIPGATMWSESADPIGAQDKGMPVVYVIPTTNRGRYVYRLRSEEYQENEFLGLCRSLVRDDPNLVVRIIPDERLSRDEIGLVSARLRDNGVKTVTVLNPSGTERRLSTSSSSTL